MLHGSINHVSITVSDLAKAMRFFGPLLDLLGYTVGDGPGEFPFGPGGYYAVYFRGPDGLKLEAVHMPLAERRARALRGPP